MHKWYNKASEGDYMLLIQQKLFILKKEDVGIIMC